MATIRISESAYKRLKKVGTFGESCDDVVVKILDLYEKKSKEMKV
jgi:predicted CopG family antitoxin